jgi:RNA polymerase sigma-70 factor (ECF subfamily)
MGGESYALGRAAHPLLQVPPAAFTRCVAAALAEAPDRTADQLALGDLYLACACMERVPGAAAAFKSLFHKVIRRTVARVLPNPADRDEATQKALDSLLVGQGQPKLGHYRGQGPLSSWVAVVAIRVAISTGRAETAERRLREKIAADATGAISPELTYMKRELRAELEDAVGEALQGLPDRERLVLRLYLVSGMTVEAIGKTFGVSQPTVSRWLARARDGVSASVRRALGERLKVGRADLASIARLVMSELDVSISRLLA